MNWISPPLQHDSFMVLIVVLTSITASTNETFDRLDKMTFLTSMLFRNDRVRFCLPYTIESAFASTIGIYVLSSMFDKVLRFSIKRHNQRESDSYSQPNKMFSCSDDYLTEIMEIAHEKHSGTIFGGAVEYSDRNLDNRTILLWFPFKRERWYVPWNVHLV